jgi:hypothetical protein
MRDDIKAMVDKTDQLTKELNQHADMLTVILDRGNKPSINFVDGWSSIASRSVELLDELRTFAAFLRRDVANVESEEIAELADSQILFHAAQIRQDAVIRRTKKALGLIP